MFFVLLCCNRVVFYSTTTAIFSRESGEQVVRAKCGESIEKARSWRELLDPEKNNGSVVVNATAPNRLIVM